MGAGAVRGDTQPRTGQSDGLLMAGQMLNMLLHAAVLAAVGSEGAVARASLPSRRPVPLTLPAGEPVRALAACDAGLVLVTAAGVRILDPMGRPLRNLWFARAAPGQRRTESHGLTTVPGLAPHTGWVAPYDPDDVEQDDPRFADAQDYDGPPRSRRDSGPAANLAFAAHEPLQNGLHDHQWQAGSRDRLQEPIHGGAAAYVAAGGAWAWVARDDGLWQVDIGSGSTTRALSWHGRSVRAVVGSSPNGRVVVVGDAAQILRSSDGGKTFQSVAAVARTPRILAANDDGTVFIVDGPLLSVVWPDRWTPQAVSGIAVTSLAVCGGDAVVVAEGSVQRISRAAADVVMARLGPAPPGSERIACGPGRAPWVAGGTGLWISGDQGRSWIPHTDLPPARILAMAVTAFTIWVATPTELLPLAIAGTGAKAGGGAIERRPDPRTAGAQWDSPVKVASVPTSLPASLPNWRWWYAGLPRVDFIVETARTTTRQEVFGFILATFTLGSPRLRWAREDALRREIARRRAAGWRSVPPTATASDDMFAADERRALARIVEEQR